MDKNMPNITSKSFLLNQRADLTNTAMISAVKPTPLTDIDQRYIEILEKTNQQLGLLTNPYGIMVTSLSVLFTVLTLVAIYFQYKQSQDYKNKVEEDRQVYRKKLEDFFSKWEEKVNERHEQIKQQVAEKYDKKLHEMEEKMKVASDEQKTKIQKEIDRLQNDKIDLQNQIIPVEVTPEDASPYEFYDEYSFSPSLIKPIKRQNVLCLACGFQFQVVEKTSRDYSSAVYSVASTSKRVVCPKCGYKQPYLGMTS